jgi:aminoglycoside phosphotransferase (APT) family kinase protein
VNQSTVLTTYAGKAAEPESAFPWLGALDAWMSERNLGSGSITQVTPLTGGTQNILLRFERGDSAFVLRRPSLHPRPESNKAMLREARVLAALKNTNVPHPEMIAQCEDESVMGAAFYLMAPVAGYNPTVAMPEAICASATARHAMGLSLVDGLAKIAQVDHVAVGLEDFGRIDGFLERQATRWVMELERYSRFPEWTGHLELGDVSPITDWLAAHCPASCVPGIIHGDYHIGNVLFRDDGGLGAIVDWEMATIGDPLMDLARLLATWPDPEAPASLYMRVAVTDGFPSREAMIERYAQRTGRDLSGFKWFEILADYKLGILFEGTYARAQAGKAPRATGERLHAAAVALLTRARRRIEEQ